MLRMATSKDWPAKVKGLLRAELARRQLSYADLAERLQAMEVKEDTTGYLRPRPFSLAGVLAQSSARGRGRGGPGFTRRGCT
jgi:hypothetical protein